MADDAVATPADQQTLSQQIEEAVDKVAPEERGPPLACIFVANIGNDTTEDAIRNVFVQYGDILKMRLLKDRSARPYAFIQYRTVDQANTALVQGAKQNIDGKRLRTERAKVNRTLFIAKMDRNITQQQLRELMERFGEIENATIIKNHATNKSKGCGFVKFTYREDAMDAFTALKNDPVLHWVVEWATNANEPAADVAVDRCNLFVGGLSPSSVTKELLEEKFKVYGTIESVTLINTEVDGNAGSVPQGLAGKSAYAFVRFAEPQAALKAMERESGREWLDKRKMRVQYCESQEQKNKRKQSKFLSSTGLIDQAPPPLLMDEMTMLGWPLAPSLSYGLSPYPNHKDSMGNFAPPTYLTNFAPLLHAAPMMNPYQPGPHQWMHQPTYQLPPSSLQVPPLHQGMAYHDDPNAMLAHFSNLSLHAPPAPPHSRQQAPYPLW